MADNFNMKKFLTENKLGPYSRIKEDDMNEGESQVHFYITGLTNDKKNQQIKDIAAKVGLNIKMKIIDPENNVQITLPGGNNFKMKDAEKIAKILDRLDVEWEDTIGLGFSMSETKEDELSLNEYEVIYRIENGRCYRIDDEGNKDEVSMNKCRYNETEKKESIEEEFSTNYMERMDGLVPQTALKALIVGAQAIIRDFKNEGFEDDEIFDYIVNKIKTLE